MESRIIDWHAALTHVVDRSPVPNGLRLRFDQNAPLADISRLAAAEVECCSFFTMNLDLDRDGVTLEVTAPADAQPFLESLFGAPA